MTTQLEHFIEVLGASGYDMRSLLVLLHFTGTAVIEEDNDGQIVIYTGLREDKDGNLRMIEDD